VNRILIFAAVLLGTVIGGAMVITRLYPQPEVVRAVWISAWIAMSVQTVGFGFAWFLRKDNAMLGWGAGLLLRFLSLGVYAFVGVKALGLSATPALLSLVGFYFVTTLVEPVLLQMPDVPKTAPTPNQ
jgi:hypothetical protein